MNILCALAGLNVLFIFFYKREWLFGMKPFLILLLINALLFALSSLLIAKGIADIRYISMLKISLIYQIIIYFLLIIFRLLFHRDPVDTFFTADKRLFADGIFNFLCIVALTLPVFFIFH